MLERLAQTCVDSSNKNYTKDKHTLTIDYLKGPIVYYEDTVAETVCLCIAWPTLYRDGKQCFWSSEKNLNCGTESAIKICMSLFQ